MAEKMYYTAAEVSAMLGVSMTKAYRILRDMNEDLDKHNFLTIAGKIPVSYFQEKWYGGVQREGA